MNQKNKSILIGLGLLVLGGVLGYIASERNYGAGPLASLSSQKSSASMPGGLKGVCARLYGAGWRDNGVTASGYLVCSKVGEQDRLVSLRPDLN